MGVAKAKKRGRTEGSHIPLFPMLKGKKPHRYGCSVDTTGRQMIFLSLSVEVHEK